MAAVQVTIKNKSGQTVALTLDDERDAEQIEYFQTLKRRDELDEVHVKKADDGGAKRPVGRPRKSDDAFPAETQD